ncbi:MAG: site-specific integrase [SAR324 cluster bacterium]|nr:site-specific integrase [SAR324 cluster bacterium]
MIKKETNGTFTVTFSTRNKRGKKLKRQKSGVKTLTKAKRIENDFIAELKNKKSGSDYAGERFGSFFTNHYLPYYEVNFTDVDYTKLVVGKWCQSIFQVQLELITPNDISLILSEAAPELSYNSLKKLKSYLSRAFNYAVKGGLPSNPVSLVKIPKQKEETKAKVLTREEANLLIIKSKELRPEWYKIWAFQLFTGMRSGESFALLKQDVDLENNTISISKSWNSKVGIKSTKTGGWRLVPISQTLKPMIIELMQDQSNGESLLPHPVEWKRGSQAVVLRLFCQAIGITPICFHDLRATFITQMFASGANIAQVQAIVGHSELKTTQVYLRLAGVDVKGATEVLSFVNPLSDHSKKVVDIHARMELVGTQLASNG